MWKGNTGFVRTSLQMNGFMQASMQVNAYRSAVCQDCRSAAQHEYCVEGQW